MSKWWDGLSDRTQTTIGFLLIPVVIPILFIGLLLNPFVRAAKMIAWDIGEWLNRND